jgi:hypothetical protein
MAVQWTRSPSSCQRVALSGRFSVSSIDHSCIERAFKINAATLGPNLPNVAGSLLLLGRVFVELNESTKPNRRSNAPSPSMRQSWVPTTPVWPQPCSNWLLCLGFKASCRPASQSRRPVILFNGWQGRSQQWMSKHSQKHCAARQSDITDCDLAAARGFGERALNIYEASLGANHPN